MANIAYFRVSTQDQSVEAQQHQLGKVFSAQFDKTFCDVGVSGATPAASRAGFKALSDYIREGDTLYVYALDRLGRDAIDVQQTVKSLLDKGVTLHVNGLGVIAFGAGQIIVAVLAQVAELERNRIRERTEAGREAARTALEATGRTHRGKPSLGRPKAHDAASIRVWRDENKASISKTAEHFKISAATVSRACRAS